MLSLESNLMMMTTIISKYGFIQVHMEINLLRLCSYFVQTQIFSVVLMIYKEEK